MNFEKSKIFVMDYNWKTSSERLRDYNSFYHFVIAVDYTNSTDLTKLDYIKMVSKLLI